jgi:hypothetical protein
MKYRVNLTEIQVFEWGTATISGIPGSPADKGMMEQRLVPP